MDEHRLDGNAAAGLLAEVFTFDITTARAACTGCGATGEVGAGYFDEVAQIVAGGGASTTALTGSTEEAQFDTLESPVTGLPGSTEDEQFVG